MKCIGTAGHPLPQGGEGYRFKLGVARTPALGVCGPSEVHESAKASETVMWGEHLKSRRPQNRGSALSGYLRNTAGGYGVYIHAHLKRRGPSSWRMPEGRPLLLEKKVRQRQTHT
jgi:hypothetical protein